MTYTIAVCFVNNSWWWAGELSETCRVSFQKWIWEISASSWLYYEINSMKQSPSWEAKRPSGNQEFSRILWNPKIHCRIHNNPPPVLILIQINPIHVPRFHFLKILINVHLGPPRGLPPPKLCTHLSCPHTWHTNRSSHSSWFDDPNNIFWWKQIIKLLVA